MNTATKESIKLGVFFFVLFTAYMSFQNIVTHIYQDMGLTGVGPLNLICNYLSFMITNALATGCKKSFKTQMLVGCAGYGLNLSTGIYAPYFDSQLLIYIIVATGGGLAGITSGYLWVSQGGYLREACKGEADKGKYSAIFQFLFCASNLMAGFITTFFLGFFSSQVYFIALTILTVMAAIFGVIFLLDTKEQSLHPQETQKFDSVEEYRIPDTESNEVSSLLTENQALASSTGPSAMKQLLGPLKSTVSFYKVMWPVLIVLVVDGISLGVYSNQLPRLIPRQASDSSQQNIDKEAGILNIFSGLGSALSAYFIGRVCDWVGLKNAVRIVILWFVLTCASTYIAVEVQEYAVAGLVAFMWGSNVFMVEGWMSVAILKLYRGKLEAFAINKQLHALFMAVFQTLVIVTSNHFDLKLFMIVFSLIAIPWWLLTNYYLSYEAEAQFHKKKQNLPQ